MDETVLEAVAKINESTLKAIPLADVEEMDPRLLEIKPSRSRGEYCWTLTSFTYQAVFAKDPSASRVTYIDADLYFFGPASNLLKEMDESGSDVLITEHAYAPEYRQEERAGIYCVQFLPVRANASGLEVIKWWQDRCIEWCYARFEDGKFGDQKYLDDWPQRWSGRVSVLQNKALTLAPWNVNHLCQGEPTGIYHFHGLRIFDSSRIRLWSCYQVNLENRKNIYDPYIQNLLSCQKEVVELGIPWRAMRLNETPKEFTKRLGRIFIKRNESWVSAPMMQGHLY